MNQEQSANLPQWGFISSDGQFQSILSLTAANLEYASKSVTELQTLLKEYVLVEEYEKCAIIRDEILRRTA